jgi:hypothetical protein
VDNELSNINIRSPARNSIHVGLGALHQQQAAGQELRRGQDHGDLQRHVGTGGGEAGDLIFLIILFDFQIYYYD